LQVRRGEITLKIRVEVAGIEDSAAVCRLNPKARKDLGVNLNETIEVVPASHPLGSVGVPLAVQPAFKDDLLSDEPILRMSREDRERLGIEVGSFVQVRHKDHKIPVRVDVSAAGDAEGAVCRLNPIARTLLEAETGEIIEVVPPETLILLIDISGSMNDSLGWGKSKIKATKSAIGKLIRNKTRSEENDRVGVIAFETHTHLIAKPTTKYDTVQDRVEHLYAEGGTGLHEGLEYALKLLREAPGLRRILLLTDGVPTTTKADPILAIAREAKDASVVIDTVGVGGSGKKDRYDEQPLRTIAAMTGGRFLHVEDIRALEEGFLMLGD
ncbi:MAG: VWA domain-containing protein, partial [Nitrospirae bacterium]|nr:VWA domain-containing protein [Nitrospirota bacterium]